MQPPALLLNLSPPTCAGEDRIVPLAQVARGVYEALLEPPAAARWRLTLEDAGRLRRLSADARVPQDNIIGEVNRPGKYPLVVPTNVMQALVNAGGFKDFANQSPGLP